jgi:site-specific recombinase XerD
MLETYFVKPTTIDRIRASWVGAEVERYADWLTHEGYASRCVRSRVPLLLGFGEFARRRGAGEITALGSHIEAFVAERVSRFGRVRANDKVMSLVSKEVRGPVEQMLELVVPGFEGTSRRPRKNPFAEATPGFFEFLVSDRGLRPASVNSYRFHLDRFEAYLRRVEIELRQLSPTVLSAFVAERSGAGLAKTTVRDCCGVLRVFLRYAYREGVVDGDLSSTVEWPQVYRLSSIPRSISWEEVGKVLEGVDRRTPCGRRDYAILLLLVTYGLRAREVAALTLDAIDWKRERLAVPERKAGHSTAFPLSRSVGEALVAYLQLGRPQTPDRHVFFRAVAPVRPIGAAAISSCARTYLIRAGVDVPRRGSHTLRHTLVQRLVDSEFSLNAIGDFVGHRLPASTQIYAKVAVESLRQVALGGDGEEVLG